jgi:hypothetical protein
MFLAMCVVILRAICYQYFRSGFILLNKANPAAVNTCPVCCMRALMSCRFSSTLLHLLIFLVGDGDVSLDLIGDVDRDDAWDVVCDDVGVVVFDVVDPCCSANISALMFSIILCCFPLCCMSDFAILSLFFSHSAAIWCLLRSFRLPDTFFCPCSRVRCILLGWLASLILFVVAVVGPVCPALVVALLGRRPCPCRPVDCLFRLACQFGASSAPCKKTSFNAYFVASFHCFNDVVCVSEIVESEELLC